MHAFPDLLYQHEKAKQDILGLEPRHDLRDREDFILLVPHDRADMAREHEPVEFCLALFEQPFHGRRDDAVAG